MKFVNTTILPLLFGIVIGIVVSDFFSWTFWNVLLLSAIVIASLSVHLFLSLRKAKFKKGFVVHSFIVSIFVGVLINKLHNPTLKDTHYINQLAENQYYLFKGQVIRKISESDFGKSYEISLHKANEWRISGNILCFFPKETQFLEKDKIVYFSAKCNAIAPPKNMYQFDFKQYMKRQNIYWQTKVNSYIVDNQQVTYSIEGMAQKVRLHLFEVLDTNFSKETANLLKTLLLGERSELDEDIYQNYIDAGAVHILAISGLHVGIITYILLFFLKKIPNIGFLKKLRLLILLLLLWGFAFLTGLSASVLRAVTMFSFLGVSSLISRQQGRFDSLLASAFFLLIIRPNFLYDIGFQLSYMAVFSILVFYSKMEKCWKPKQKWLQPIWSMFLISLSAQMGVLPISLYYFHQFPILFFVSNLLIVPLLSPVLIIGFLTLFMSIFGELPYFFVFILEKMISIMNYLAKIIASQEIFIIRNIYFDEIMLIFSFLIITFLIFWLEKRNFRRTFALLSCILVFQIVLFFIKYENQKVERFVVFHNHKQSLISIQKSSQLAVYQSDTTQVHPLIMNYAKCTGISHIKLTKIPYLFDYQKDMILYMDSLGIYPQSDVSRIDKVIISKSPKINFERMLLKIRPKIVIADGTNSKRLLTKWKEKCTELGIPFHFTNDSIVKY